VTAAWSPQISEDEQQGLITALSEVWHEADALPTWRALAARGSKFVMGWGSLRPRVVLVGEAPGEDEDRERMPFVGRSGQLLDRLLAESGVSRELDCWVTNVVKRRPPDETGKNRTPTGEEVRESAPYLLREVELLAPLVVVTLGNTPLRVLHPGGTTISRCHGMARALDSGLVHLPAYHPSYALRSADGEQELREDLAMLGLLLRPTRTMRVGSTGTRHGCTPEQLAALRQVLRELPGRELHHGDCVGFDDQAHDVAESLGYRVVVHPPTESSLAAGRAGDERREPRPYLVRNEDILRETEELVACPSGPESMRSGTWSTVRRARQLRRPITTVWPDGRVERRAP
jgi:DNA polymerase